MYPAALITPYTYNIQAEATYYSAMPIIDVTIHTSHTHSVGWLQAGPGAHRTLHRARWAPGRSHAPDHTGKIDISGHQGLMDCGLGVTNLSTAEWTDL